MITVAFVAAKIYASKLGLVNCASAHARASAVLPGTYRCLAM